MGGGSHSVFHTHSPRRIARTTYSSHPSPYRQESTHDNDSFRSSRPNHDPLLQIPDRQCPCVLLRWNGGSSVILAII
jgi:hypothetical protein